MDISSIMSMRYNAVSSQKASLNHEQISTTETQATHDDMFWQDLSNKYNVENMSFDDLKSLSYELREEGIISPKEYAILTFPADKWLSESRHGEYSMNVTKADANGNRNWIEEFSERLKLPAPPDAGEKQGAHYEKMIMILQKVQSDGLSINQYA